METPLVRPGDKLRIPAALWNILTDVADDYKAEQFPVHVKGQKRRINSGIVIARNTTTTNYTTSSVLGVDGLTISPADDTSLTYRFDRPIFDLVAPTVDHKGRFAVLLESIPAGRFGKAIISGVVVVRIHYTKIGTPAFAEVAATQTDYLEGGDVGSARVLWKDTVEIGDSDTYWGIVNLGVGGGSAAGFVKITSLGPIMGDWKPSDSDVWDTNAAAHYNVVDEGNGHPAVDGVFPGYKNDITLSISSVKSAMGKVKVISLDPFLGDFKPAGATAYDTNYGVHFTVVDEGNGAVIVNDVLPGVRFGNQLEISSFYDRVCEDT